MHTYVNEAAKAAALNAIAMATTISMTSGPCESMAEHNKKCLGYAPVAFANIVHRDGLCVLTVKPAQGVAETSGTATHVALLSGNDVVLCVRMNSSKSVTSGAAFATTSFDISI